MRAVVVTVFMYRYAYEQTIAAGLWCISTTLVSFVLCFACPVVFPFSMRGIAILIGTRFRGAVWESWAN
jgi:hypothetical protein